MRRFAFAVLVLAFAAPLPLAACNRAKPTPAECGQMLDHYLDMTIAADPALVALPPAQAELAREMKKETKKADASYRRVAEQCQREVSRAEYKCAMNANGPNEWEACIE